MIKIFYLGPSCEMLLWLSRALIETILSLLKQNIHVIYKRVLLMLSQIICKNQWKIFPYLYSFGCCNFYLQVFFPRTFFQLYSLDSVHKGRKSDQKYSCMSLQTHSVFRMIPWLCLIYYRNRSHISMNYIKIIFL